MHFIARASEDEEYQKWIKAAKKSPKALGLDEYNILAAPSKNNPVEIYQLKR